jgi:hypothetical protein
MNPIDCLWGTLLQDGKLWIGPVEVQDHVIFLKFYRVCGSWSRALIQSQSCVIGVTVHKRFKDDCSSKKKLKSLISQHFNDHRKSIHLWMQVYESLAQVSFEVFLRQPLGQSVNQLIGRLERSLGSEWIHEDAVPKLISAINDFTKDVKSNCDSYTSSLMERFPSSLVEVILVYVVPCLQYNMADHISANTHSLQERGYCEILTCYARCDCTSKYTFSGMNRCLKHLFE